MVVKRETHIIPILLIPKIWLFLFCFLTFCNCKKPTTICCQVKSLILLTMGNSHNTFWYLPPVTCKRCHITFFCQLANGNKNFPQVGNMPHFFQLPFWPIQIELYLTTTNNHMLSHHKDIHFINYLKHTYQVILCLRLHEMMPLNQVPTIWSCFL